MPKPVEQLRREIQFVRENQANDPVQINTLNAMLELCAHIDRLENLVYLLVADNAPEC